MEKFKELVSKCKCSVEICVNDHRDVYETVEGYIDNHDKKEIEEEVFNEMIKTDTIVRLQFYPKTPIESYVVYHYDIDKAVDKALEIMN